MLNYGLQQADIEDALQDAFAKLCNAAARGTEIGCPRAFAWKTLKNRVIDGWRKKRRWRSVELPPDLQSQGKWPKSYDDEVEWYRWLLGKSTPKVAESIELLIQAEGDFEMAALLLIDIEGLSPTPENVTRIRKRFAKYRVDFRTDVERLCPDML